MVMDLAIRSKRVKVYLGGLLCLSMIMFGCATTPTLGEQMVAQSEGGTDLGQQWNEGQQLLRKGEKMTARGEEKIADGKKKLRRGEDDVHEGQQLVEEGRDLIAKGRALMSASEAAYQSRFPKAYQQFSPAR